MSAKKGVLLCNIGTPDSYQNADVARYLREFLMDEEILTVPFLLRYPLVNWGIVPRRASYSAKNYRSIWTEQGSPLMVNSLNLQQNLQQDLGSDYLVEIGMRYGSPSIQKALADFKNKNILDILIVPLYPQYARATTESTLKKVNEFAKENPQFRIQHVPAFYNEEKYISAIGDETRRFLQQKKVDYYLMTYHGLPLSQNNRMPAEESYRRQCEKTSALIAQNLKIPDGQWSFSFQSRVGVENWIRPYTDETLKELAQKGIKNLAVLCPSFVSDCLETIEEIGVEGQHIFKSHGGENFYLVPCLNERADYLSALIQKKF